jgi:hypothetical protein
MHSTYLVKHSGNFTFTWGRRQFGNPEEVERPPLEAVTKQRNEDRDCEH